MGKAGKREISNLMYISESADRGRYEYSCGFERDEGAPDANTRWVRDRNSPFSSLSTPLSGSIPTVPASPRTGPASFLAITLPNGK